jgi:hypothetical protein
MRNLILAASEEIFSSAFQPPPNYRSKKMSENQQQGPRKSSLIQGRIKQL